MFPDRQSIPAFLDWLRNGGSGFEASDHQFLNAQALVEAILQADYREFPVAVAWSTFLAPVLCSSEAQQTEFYALFSSWFSQTRIEVGAPPTKPETGKKRLNLDVWLYGLAALTLVVLMVWLGHRYWPRGAKPPQVTAQPALIAPSTSVPLGAVLLRIEYVNAGIGDSTVQYAGRSMRPDNAGYLTLPRMASSTYLQVTAPRFKPAVIPFPQSNRVVQMTPAYQRDASRNRG